MTTYTPELPLGTRVRARLSGWGADGIDENADAVDVPSFDGCPEFVEGELEGYPVEVTNDSGYFKHVVAGYDVDPTTLEKLGDSNGEGTAVTSSASGAGISASDNQRLLDIDRELRTKLYVAFNDHMARALEKAGAKVRTKLSKTASGRQWLSAHPAGNGVLARLAPRALLAAGGLEEQMLLDAAWNELEPIWYDYVASGDMALLRQIAKMTGIDINTMSAQEAALTAASEEGWAYVRAQLQETALGYLSDSASVVAIDQITTTDLVEMGTVRKSVGYAGGAGSQDPTSAGLLIDNSHGVGVAPQLSTGPIAGKAMEDGGLEIESYTWKHGFTPSPFPPHEALDGVEFLTWQDPQLFNSDSFPPLDYYAPGDHQGCQCDFMVNWAQKATTAGAFNTELARMGGKAQGDNGHLGLTNNQPEGSQ